MLLPSALPAPRRFLRDHLHTLWEPCAQSQIAVELNQGTWGRWPCLPVLLADTENIGRLQPSLSSIAGQRGCGSWQIAGVNLIANAVSAKESWDVQARSLRWMKRGKPGETDTPGHRGRLWYISWYKAGVEHPGMSGSGAKVAGANTLFDQGWNTCARMGGYR